MKKLDDLKSLFDNLKPNKLLDEDQMTGLTGMVLSKRPLFSEVATSDNPEFKPEEFIMLKILLKRLEVKSTVKITFGVAILLASEMMNPGQAVTYAYYIHRKMKPNSVVDLMTFSTQLFPYGFISDEQHKEIYEAQVLNIKEKEEAAPLGCHMAHDKLLDYNGTWE